MWPLLVEAELSWGLGAKLTPEVLQNDLLLVLVCDRSARSRKKSLNVDLPSAPIFFLRGTTSC
jgi:hypothetical protein